MIQIDEHIFQVGWNHQLETFIYIPYYFYLDPQTTIYK